MGGLKLRARKSILEQWNEAASPSARPCVTKCAGVKSPSISTHLSWHDTDFQISVLVLLKAASSPPSSGHFPNPAHGTLVDRRSLFNLVIPNNVFHFTALSPYVGSVTYINVPKAYLK